MSVYYINIDFVEYLLGNFIHKFMLMNFIAYVNIIH